MFTQLLRCQMVPGANLLTSYSNNLSRDGGVGVGGGARTPLNENAGKGRGVEVTAFNRHILLLLVMGTNKNH